MNAMRRDDAQTQKIRIVTVVKRTGIGWFERMEAGSNRAPVMVASTPVCAGRASKGWITIDKSNVGRYPF